MSARRQIARFSLVLAFALAIPTGGHAQDRREAPSWNEIYANYPVVELVTMGIGARLWERHGHVALCVRYRDRRLDRCYNYGTAEFDKPLKMAWGFFRGTRSFWASAQSPAQMLRIYEIADRTIWVQPLPLSGEEEQAIIAKVEEDILPENRYYAYDHFWDNCTTRIRDIIDDATGGRLSSMKVVTPERTIRDLARDGFFGMRIPLLITDIQMARATDVVPTYYERMFLPDYLREAVELEFGIEPRVVYQRRGPAHVPHGPTGRVLFALVILLMTSPAWLTRLWGRFTRLGLAVAVLPPVLLSSVQWMLAIVSPLSYVRWNESCLVLVPFDLALLLLPEAKRRAYAKVRLALVALLALLMLVGVLRQPIWPLLLWAAIPSLSVLWRPAPAKAAA